MTKKAQILPSGGETDGKPPGSAHLSRHSGPLVPLPHLVCCLPGGRFAQRGCLPALALLLKSPAWAIISMTYCMLP